MQRLRIILGHLVRWVWMPVLAKMCLWIGAFVALAHVGTNAAVRVTSPAPLTADRAIGHAPVASASVSAGVSVGASARASPCASGPAAVTQDGRVVLNRASIADLRRLPGVGEKRATAILEVRERLGGRFRHLRDLLRVRGIGPRSLARLEPLVVLDAPSESAGGGPSR
ncbi:MAG TPA: helix-hairpin-helix domain-containing protein [Polyangiaceae bacterium]|nr:helix-hairpin-helix domain-containing protein [Polyangiaceae bacterium]